MVGCLPSSTFAGRTIGKSFRPLDSLRESFRLAPLITAIGMSIVLQNFIQVAQGARVKPLQPVVTGGYRLGDVRHGGASPARAAAEHGFSAEVHPEQGLPAFATAPLRD